MNKLLRKEIQENYDSELLLADGFDDCIIGVAEGIALRVPVVCYDKDKIIESLAQDMSYEEAIEYFEFNMIGAYMGESTPIYITTHNTQNT